MSSVADNLPPLPGAIEPRWWTGTPALPPESFTIDCADYAMGEADLDQNSDLARTMNRVFDEAFPNTVCEVVRQGAMDGRKAQRNLCQFSWWCDGRSDRPVDERSQYIDWADSFDRGPQIGKHLFYRRPGSAPEPEPFYLPWSL